MVQISEYDWNLLRAEVTFDKYVDCNKDIILSVICSVDEVILNSQSEMNCDSDGGEEYQEVVSPTFQDHINCVGTLRIYFVCHNTSKITFQDLNSMHKSLIAVHLQSSC